MVGPCPNKTNIDIMHESPMHYECMAESMRPEGLSMSADTARQPCLFAETHSTSLC